MIPSTKNFADWESSAFGYGYGTGENYTIPALKRFLDLVSDKEAYDYQVLERELGSGTAWLLINALCKVNIIEYGSSPRHGWLTREGQVLKEFCGTKTNDELIEMTVRSEDDFACYPDACNCGPNGYEAGRKCVNPFWR